MSDEVTPEPEPIEAEEPQFNPLQTWDQLVSELGDPTSIPEEDLDR
jgi:hypothetical protein